MGTSGSLATHQPLRKGSARPDSLPGLLHNLRAPVKNENVGPPTEGGKLISPTHRSTSATYNDGDLYLGHPWDLDWSGQRAPLRIPPNAPWWSQPRVGTAATHLAQP